VPVLYNSGMFVLTIKYRLQPTAAQETALRGMLATAHDVYNSLVNWRKYDYELQGKAPSCADQQKALPLWKKAHPQLCDVNAQVLQEVAKRVDRAFEAFFRRVKAGETPGYPRLKGKGQYDSLTYPQATAFAVGEDAIRLSKVGCVKAVVHRPLPGKAKTCTVRLQAGKWFACVTCEVEAEPLPESTEAIGIDVGLNVFAALSNGEFVENPRFFRKDEKSLAKAQRKTDKFKHARSQEQKAARRKAYKVVSRIHERIRNRRHDFVHQLSRKLVNRFGLIAVEALRVDNMVRRPKPKPDPDNAGQFLPNGASAKSGLNKSIVDAAWSMFRNCLTYKAASASRQEVNVNPAYTSQDCSGCGQRVPKTLKERVHVCPCCGLVLDRDVNAARNILKIGMGQHTVVGIPT
jgi:putative transposase